LRRLAFIQYSQNVRNLNKSVATIYAMTSTVSAGGDQVFRGMAVALEGSDDE